jgi:hypothetical protein
MVIATVCAAISAIFSAVGVFRQENATYTTVLYVKEVDTITTFLSTINQLDTLTLYLLLLFDQRFSKPPYPSKEIPGLKLFVDKADSTIENIFQHMSVLLNQASMITIFAPVELGEHFQTVHRYFHEILVPFKHALDSIRQQIQVAATNPQQQVVIDVSVLRTTLEQYNKLITNEEGIILHCIRPQLATGRPMIANSDLANCFGKK